MAPSASRIHALLIGVESYSLENFNPKLNGPFIDVDSVKKFLTDDLHTPPKNILVLKDPTRAKILESFQTHLINNPSIRPGCKDPLLLYFSGHGGRVLAPSTWPITDSERKHEVIIASDCNRAKKIEPIPDRTISALLVMVSRRHGDNITVIFDCCHSLHATRKPGDSLPTGSEARSVPEHLIPPLSQDTDRHIWSRQEVTQERRRKPAGEYQRSLGDPSNRSHVLLAACRQLQSAYSCTTPPLGGYFTNALLRTLRECHSQNLYWSYPQIIQDVQKRLKKLEKFQIPEALGWLLERPLFEAFVETGRFRVEKTSVPYRYRIAAGHLHAIAPDTRFAIFMDIRSTEVIAEVLPDEVNSVECLATLPTRDPTLLYASIISQGTGRHLQVHIPETTQGSYRALYSLVWTASTCPIDVVEDETKADLIIEADAVTAGQFYLIRRDPLLSDDRISRLKVPANLQFSASPEKVVSNLAQISFFNFHLYHLPVHHTGFPLRKKVTVGLGAFTDALAGGLEIANTGPMPVSSHTGALEMNVVPDKEYVLVFKNNTNRNLFFYLLYFDPLTYEITVMYKPSQPQEYTRPGGSLQLGRSLEFGELAFQNTTDTDIEVGFMKLYMLTSRVDLDSLAQRGIFLPMDQQRIDDKKDLNNVTERTDWDAVVIKVLAARADSD